MKKIIIPAAFILFCLLVKTNSMAQTKKPKPKTPAPATELKLKTRADKVSYGIGLNIAQNLVQQGFDSLNVKVLSKAFEDIFKHKKPILSIEEANLVINEYFQEIQAKKSAKGSEEGKKFLEENKTKPGVVTLPSGLQYMIITEGSGEIPKATDKVKTHYHGTLINGKVFDSSVQRGEPATFPVNGVIQGWQEALQLMKVGSKWKLFVPAELAYGDRGAGNDIPPGSALIFEVELLSIEKQ